MADRRPKGYHERLRAFAQDNLARLKVKVEPIGSVQTTSSVAFVECFAEVPLDANGEPWVAAPANGDGEV